MEIKKLVDLNNLRTAPQLSNIQLKNLLEDLEANIRGLKKIMGENYE